MSIELCLDCLYYYVLYRDCFSQGFNLPNKLKVRMPVLPFPEPLLNLGCSFHLLLHLNIVSYQPILISYSGDTAAGMVADSVTAGAI